METIYLLPPFHLTYALEILAPGFLTYALEILALKELFGASGFLGETAQSYNLHKRETILQY